MYNDHIIVAVVPAFQEERHILQVLERMPELVDHVVVVDDGSRDATAERVRSCTDPRVELVVHDRNRGVGAAIVTGHRRALELGGDVSVVIAGDGQADTSFLPSLLDPLTLDGFGFAKANRFFSATSYEGMPPVRVAGAIALTFLSKAASGYWNIVDPQNGYTAVRCDVLERLDLDLLAEGYSFENDMLIWLNILDVPAVDVPVPARYGDETSTMRIGRDGMKIAHTLHRGFWRRMWRKYVLWSFSPVALLFFTGLLMLLFATVAAALAIRHAFLPGALPAAPVLLVVGPGILGTQLLLQALTLDIQATPSSPLTHPLPSHQLSSTSIHPPVPRPAAPGLPPTPQPRAAQSQPAGSRPAQSRAAQSRAAQPRAAQSPPAPAPSPPAPAPERPRRAQRTRG